MSHVCTRKLSSWSWRRRGRFTTTTPSGCNVKRESWERKAPGLLPAQPSKSTGRLRKTETVTGESRQDHQPTLAKLPWPTLLTRGRQCDTTRSRGCFLNTHKAESVLLAATPSLGFSLTRCLQNSSGGRQESRRRGSWHGGGGTGCLCCFSNHLSPPPHRCRKKTNFVACHKQRSPPQPWYFDPGRCALALRRG